jgi:hypothetical protein
MQAFTTVTSKDLAPLEQPDQKTFDFLAFGGPIESTKAVEYEHGKENKQTTSAPNEYGPLFQTDSVGNGFYNGFASTSTFAMRYKDIANPVAYGDDYTVRSPEKTVAKKVMIEKAEGDNNTNERPRYLMYTEKTNGKKDDTFGYKETWKQKKEQTVVTRVDDSECMRGQMLVNNQCFAISTPNVKCPDGFVFDNEAQFCVPIKEKQSATTKCLDPNATMNAKGECVIKMI